MSVSIEKQTDRILTFRLYEKETSAVIYYTLNLDRYTLSIGGETSGFYKWVETPSSESFLDLMVRCDEEYLCNKLFEKVIDIAASIQAVKEYIADGGLFDEDYEADEKASCFDDLDSVDVDCCSCFVSKVSEILSDYDKDDSDTEYTIYDLIVKTYKYWDERAIELFCEFIKPELKKEIEEYKENHNGKDLH